MYNYIIYEYLPNNIYLILSILILHSTEVNIIITSCELTSESICINNVINS